MKTWNRLSLILMSHWIVAVLASFGFGAMASAAGLGPPGFEFGFEPGRKVWYEGVYRLEGESKGKMEILNQMIEAKEKSVVIYTRQSDDAIFKLAAALDAKGDALKDCPTHFVFLFANRKTLLEKGGRFKKISLLQSNRSEPREWEILKLDPKMTAMVFLAEHGRIKIKHTVVEGSLNDARVGELAKIILDYAAPPPTKPLNITDRLAGHPGGPRKLVFSPDGKWLYSHGTLREDGRDAHVAKWDLVSGKEVANAASHGGGGNQLEVTRDGSLLLSAGSFTEVKFWDANLKLMDTLKLPSTPFSLRLSPDEKTFAIGFADRTVRVYNLADRKERFVFKGHTDRVRAVDYSPDSKRLVSGDEFGKIKLWDVVEGKEIATWPGHTNTVECIAFSQDGKWVASGGREMRGISGPGRARLWDVETGKEVRVLESTRVNGVLAICFLDGKKKLAIAGESPLIRIIDLETGKEAGELSGHRSAIFSLALHPEGAILASGSWDGPIRLWNVKGRK